MIKAGNIVVVSLTFPSKYIITLFTIESYERFFQSLNVKITKRFVQQTREKNTDIVVVYICCTVLLFMARINLEKNIELTSCECWGGRKNNTQPSEYRKQKFDGRRVKPRYGSDEVKPQQQTMWKREATLKARVKFFSWKSLTGNCKNEFKFLDFNLVCCFFLILMLESFVVLMRQQKNARYLSAT